MLIEGVPGEISEQVSGARSVIERRLSATVQAIHLFGSAVDGGLRPTSDIDLLVTVSVPPGESVRQALMLDLLKVSAPPGSSGRWRPLEVTVVVRGDVVPWRYPARRELQFGEWLRQEILSGVIEPAVLDHDLALLLAKAREHSVAVVGAPASAWFPPLPAGDFTQALADTIAQWRVASDWQGDERNILLTLARIWYSAATGRMAPKDVAATWVLTRLPVEYRPVLSEARAAYVRGTTGWPAAWNEQTTAFILFAKAEIEKLLHS